jgi:putative ABC transport system permease protein
MVGIAWRNLVREKTRLAISVAGVAFAVLLILLLRGLYAGITAQATEYIRSVDAHVWVAEAGTPGDFFHSVTLMPGAFAG